MFNHQHIDFKCQGGISVTFASLFISQGKLHNSLGPLQTNKQKEEKKWLRALETPLGNRMAERSRIAIQL